MGRFENTPYIGAIITFLSGLNLNDIGVLLGILFTISTFIINLHYKRKELEIRKQILEKYNEKHSR